MYEYTVQSPLLTVYCLFFLIQSELLQTSKFFIICKGTPIPPSRNENILRVCQFYLNSTWTRSDYNFILIQLTKKHFFTITLIQVQCLILRLIICNTSLLLHFATKMFNFFILLSLVDEDFTQEIENPMCLYIYPVSDVTTLYFELKKDIKSLIRKILNINNT